MSQDTFKYQNQSIILESFFTENLLVIEMKKTQITMNKPFYLGLSILDIYKTVRYGFWYNYLKPKYGENVIWTHTLLNGYREIYCLCKNRRYLQTHCRR